MFGHAFGALVANEFAKSNPSAVASLILASPPAALGAPAAKQVCVLIQHIQLWRVTVTEEEIRERSFELELPTRRKGGHSLLVTLACNCE